MGKPFYIEPREKALELGIEVYEVVPSSPMVNDGGETDLMLAKRVLGAGDSGVILRDDDGGVKIYYASSDSEVRQRFTIAHEIGHYVCGHLDDNTKMFRDSAKNYSRNNYDIREYEANNYAAELLMPKAKVDFLILQENIKEVSQMAKAFRVSQEAMRIRLIKLGWLNG